MAHGFIGTGSTQSRVQKVQLPSFPLCYANRQSLELMVTQWTLLVIVSPPLLYTHYIPQECCPKLPAFHSLDLQKLGMSEILNEKSRPEWLILCLGLKKTTVTWVEAGSDYVTLQQPRTPFDPCFSAFSTRIKTTELQSPSWILDHSGVCTSSRLGAPQCLNPPVAASFCAENCPPQPPALAQLPRVPHEEYMRLIQPCHVDPICPQSTAQALMGFPWGHHSGKRSLSVPGLSCPGNPPRAVCFTSTPQRRRAKPSELGKKKGFLVL